MRRLVLDTNIYISAILTTRGPNNDLLHLAREGVIELIISEKLLDELETRLQREKFRRWVSLDEVDEFVDAITLLGTFVDDRPDNEVPHVCADPDDNFLVALFQDSDAHMLVSGDKKVRAIEYPGVFVYGPREALDAVVYSHRWGDTFLPGIEDKVQLQIVAEGAAPLIGVYTFFNALIHEPNAEELLPYAVVPETLSAFLADLGSVREMLEGRGLATRPHYASPEVAYLKLPPDPGVTLRATDDAPLPADTIFATLQYCPDIPDHEGLPFDHWRVFGIGSAVPAEAIRPRPQ